MFATEKQRKFLRLLLNKISTKSERANKYFKIGDIKVSFNTKGLPNGGEKSTYSQLISLLLDGAKLESVK